MTMTTYQCEAIKKINPNAEFTAENINDIQWLNGTTPISVEDINAKASELKIAEDNAIQTQINLKASAKAKLIAGEALTEDEANTIVL
jgi:pantothenate kinase-related protein Tda10